MISQQDILVLLLKYILDLITSTISIGHVVVVVIIVIIILVKIL